MSGIAVVDLETGNFLDVNQKWCQMTGFSPEEARGLNVAALCLDEPPYHCGGCPALDQGSLQGRPQLFEFQAKTKEGRRHWVEVNLRRVVIGGRERLLAVVRDISERKTDRGGVAGLGGQIPQPGGADPGHHLYCGAGRPVSPLIYISPQIEAILGFTPEEFLADREMFMKQIHPEDRDRVLTELLLSYAAGGAFCGRIPHALQNRPGRVGPGRIPGGV